MRMAGGKHTAQSSMELRPKLAVVSATYRGSPMGPGYFVIAILGCADGGSACTPVATLQSHYATQAECTAATSAALEENSNFDFPTLVARCRAGTAKTAEVQHDKAPTGRVRRS
jgi:hypothetical protein